MRFAVTTILIFTILLSYAQVEQPKRFEIELDAFESSYEVLSGEDQGVLLYKPLDIFQGRQELWRFIKLDTALQQQWFKEIYLDRGKIYRGYEYNNNTYSLLFQQKEYSTLDLFMLQLDDYNGDTTHHHIRSLVPIQLEEFEMTQDAAVIAGYYNQDPVVLHYSLKSRKTKVLPGIFGNKTELAQVKVDNDLIQILLTTRSYDNNNTLAIKTYDSTGEYLDSYTFDPADDIGLTFGRVASFGLNGSLICGTYGGRKSEYSRGLFIGQHNSEVKQDLRYYNYADLENFFTYLKAKRQKRISDKIDRKKVKGKKVKFNYRILVHDIIKNGDQYIMLGEAFYPKYNGNSNYNNYNGYGQYNTYGNSDNIPISFAGYRYTHAVVIGFSRNGEILWDNSFEIDDVMSYQLEQFVHADIVEDKVVLFYLYENEIRTKIINGSEVLEGKLFNNLKLSFEDDVVNDKSYNSDIGGFERWFDHNFMAYGVQKIKNMKDTGVKLNRRVFYINKIRYDRSYEASPVVEQASNEIENQSGN